MDRTSEVASPESHRNSDGDSDGDVCIDFYRYLRDKIWPVIPEALVKVPSNRIEQCPVSAIFKYPNPEYPDEINEMVSNQPTIEVGNYFDVVSLLSCNYETKHLVRSNGDRVELTKDLFKDKYVMIFCVNVPILRQSFFSHDVQAFVTMCPDLYARFRDKIEIVIVPKLHRFANCVEFFDHFLSGFPTSCLAVPFSESKCRDYICKYLNLDIPSAKFLIVDACNKALYYGVPNFLGGYGAEAFPFTSECIDTLRMEEFPRWKGRSVSTLEGLLQCNSSFELYHPTTLADNQEKMPISKLKEKVVGLYLFFNGDFLPTLSEIYKQCRDNSLEFEIVLVCLPFVNRVDPLVSEAKTVSLLSPLNLSWWKVPFNNSVFCRLCRLTAYSPFDMLVILGPNDGYVDPYGRGVMSWYGIQGFPFTRDALVELEEKKLRNVTLESLLVYESLFKRNDIVNVEQIKGRNILLYFGCLSKPCILHSLLKWYDEIKQIDSSFEVVFIRRAVDYLRLDDITEDDNATRTHMPWLVCPFNTDHSNYVQENLFSDTSPDDTLVQFGKDGHICSIDAYKLLKIHGIEAFPFEDNLHQDVIYRLETIHEFMDNY